MTPKMAAYDGSSSFTDSTTPALPCNGTATVAALPLGSQPIAWTSSAPPGFPPGVSIEQLYALAKDNWDFLFTTFASFRAHGNAVVSLLDQGPVDCYLTLTDDHVRGAAPAQPLSRSWKVPISLQRSTLPFMGFYDDLDCGLSSQDVNFDGVPSSAEITVRGCSGFLAVIAPLSLLVQFRMTPKAPASQPLAGALPSGYRWTGRRLYWERPYRRSPDKARHAWMSYPK
jgi:hypothetical protein